MSYIQRFTESVGSMVQAQEESENYKLPKLDRIAIPQWIGTILITCGVMLAGFMEWKYKTKRSG